MTSATHFSERPCAPAKTRVESTPKSDIFSRNLPINSALLYPCFIGFVVKVVFELFQEPGKADNERYAVRLGKKCWEIIEAGAVAVFVHKAPSYSANRTSNLADLAPADATESRFRNMNLSRKHFPKPLRQHAQRGACVENRFDWFREQAIGQLKFDICYQARDNHWPVAELGGRGVVSK